MTQRALGWAVKAALLGGCAAAAMPASAQTTDDETPTVTDIVVTARRTAERLQDVLQTVTAIDERAVKEFNLLTFSDISRSWRRA